MSDRLLMLSAVLASHIRRSWRILLPLFILSVSLLVLGISTQSEYASPLSLLPTFLNPSEENFYGRVRIGESKYYSTKTPSFFPPRKSQNTNDYCADFPTHRLESVQIVVKTGAGIYNKNRAHIKTVSSCISNVLIFSDLDEEIDGHHFVDVLADLPDVYYVDNPDFETYTRQKETFATEGRVGISKEGWKLDRFKFLPMVDKAYEMRPNASWYVFLETDVYFFWDTLFRLLDQLDSDRHHYLGAPVKGGGHVEFAYGGAGYVLSKGLVHSMVGDGTKLSHKFAQLAIGDCCGDAVLGYVIHELTGKRIDGLYPMFSGEELHQLRTKKEYWCVPLMGLHRVSPELMNTLWEWERTRPYDTKPLVHSTMLQLTHPDLKYGSTMDDWDNESQETLPSWSSGHASAEACAAACRSSSDCLQYAYFENSCRHDEAVAKGHPLAEGDKGKGWISGWDVDKLEKLGLRLQDPMDGGCQRAEWKKPSRGS